MPETVITEKKPVVNRQKWYFALMEKSKKWLSENSTGNILQWQEIGKSRVIECYTIMPKAGEETQNVIFTYSKGSGAVRFFVQTGISLN